MSAPPRLLCHGGTGDLTRVRIGSFPEVGRGALMDVYGLPVGSARFHFGCGVLEGRPVLVFRERQNEGNRSGYGYTMLLDPGDAVWERFGWNGALLLLALAERGGPLVNALRITPEQLSPDALARLLDGLVLPQLDLGSDSFPAEAIFLWIGIAVGEAEEVQPLRRLAPRGALTPVALARFLGSLPACFRTGAGWLAGGSRGNAEAFGCRLLLDPEAEGEDERLLLELAVRRGREMLEAWDGLRRDEALGLLVRSWEFIPLPLWAEKVGLPASALATRLVLAYRLGRKEPLGADADDEAAFVARLDAALEAGGVLVPELSRLAARRLAEGRAELRLMALLASRWLDGKGTLEGAAASKLEPEVLVETLVAKGTGPDDARVTALLGLGDRATVWAGLARKEIARKRLPELVQRAIADLAAVKATKVARGDAAAFVLDAAFDRSVALGGSLGDWEGLRKDAAIGAYVRKKLRTAAKEAAREAPPGSHWFDRDDVEFTLEDAEEEAQAVVLALLVEGGPETDERRRTRLRKALGAGPAPEAAGGGGAGGASVTAATSAAAGASVAAAAAAAAAFGEALARAGRGGSEREVLARRYVADPGLLSPLLVAAGADAAERLVAELAAAAPEPFERQAREVYAAALRDLRRGGGATPYAAALARHLRAPAARALRERIAVAVHGADAGQIDENLGRIAGRPPAREAAPPGPAGPAGPPGPGLLRNLASFFRKGD